MTDVEAARRALEDALGPDEVLSDPLALTLYARDASMVEGGCALVAFPRSIDDIVACVRIAAEHGLPIVPRGAGTGLAGAATPIGDALVVVTAKMHASSRSGPRTGSPGSSPACRTSTSRTRSVRSGSRTRPTRRRSRRPRSAAT